MAGEVEERRGVRCVSVKWRARLEFGLVFCLEASLADGEEEKDVIVNYGVLVKPTRDTIDRQLVGMSSAIDNSIDLI